MAAQRCGASAPVWELPGLDLSCDPCSGDGQGTRGEPPHWEATEGAAELAPVIWVWVQAKFQ